MSSKGRLIRFLLLSVAIITLVAAGTTCGDSGPNQATPIPTSEPFDANVFSGMALDPQDVPELAHAGAAGHTNARTLNPAANIR
jgi:hypothetical protein